MQTEKQSNIALALVDACAADASETALLRSMVCGAPLFMHAVYAAQSSDSVSHVVLLSNDAQISDIAKQQAIECVTLPENVDPDHVIDAWIQAASREAHDTEEIVVCLAARHPLVNAEDIDRFVEGVHNNGGDGLYAAAQIQLAQVRRRDGSALPQELGFVDTGAIYAFPAKSLARRGNAPNPQLRPGTLPALHSFRVGEQEDLAAIEPLLKRQPIDRALRNFDPQALILDFDGVFTDNKVIVTADGAESAVCDRSDGFAIQSLQRRGFPVLVLSTEKVPIVKARSEKLGLNCIHGVSDKAAILRDWLTENRIDPQHAIYVGNDVNDVECMKLVGLPVAVADAFPEARTVARAVLNARGGHGAVREIAMAVAKTLDATR